MNTKTIWTFFIGGLCLIWFVWAFFAWGKPAADFDQKVSAANLVRLLKNGGLEVCSERTLTLDATPGLVSGKSLEVSQACNIDKDPMSVSVLEFDSEESRNAAQQRAASTHRGGFGPHVAYSYGPYVLTIEGTRGIGNQLLLGKILNEANQ